MFICCEIRHLSDINLFSQNVSVINVLEYSTHSIMSVNARHFSIVRLGMRKTIIILLLIRYSQRYRFYDRGKRHTKAKLDNNKNKTSDPNFNKCTLITLTLRTFNKISNPILLLAHKSSANDDRYTA